MTARVGSLLARALWGVGILLLVAVIWLTFLNGLDEDPFVSFVAPLMTLGYLTVGALIASRHKRSPIGWLFLTCALALISAGFADNYVGAGLSRGEWPGMRWVAWSNNYLFVIAFAAIPFILLLFPDGRLPSRRLAPGGLGHGGLPGDRHPRLYGHPRARGGGTVASSRTPPGSRERRH